MNLSEYIWICRSCHTKVHNVGKKRNSSKQVGGTLRGVGKEAQGEEEGPL